MNAMASMVREADFLQEEALQICLEAGSLDECRLHPGFLFDGGESVQEAQAWAGSKVDSGAVTLPPSFGRQDFAAVIEAVYLGHSAIDYCRACHR